MTENRELLIICGLPVVASCFIYLLFALCYGYNPIYWGEDQKFGFIFCQLVLPGTTFIGAIGAFKKD